jgi:O-antigen/teichoic acid export membrane protein
MVMLRLASSIYYFLPLSVDKERSRVIESFIALGINVFASGMLILLFSKDISIFLKQPELESLLLWVPPFLFSTLSVDLISTILIIKDKVQISTIYTVVGRVCFALVIAVTAFTTASVYSVVFVRVIAALLFMALGMGLVVKNISRGCAKPTILGMTELYKFAIPIALSSMVGIFIRQLDKLFISSMCSSEEFVVFANGAMEIPLVSVVTGSIMSIVLVDMRKEVVNQNLKAALDLFKVAAVKSSFLLFPIMLFLFINAKSVIVLLFSERYIDSYVPFRIYLLLLPLRTMSFGSFLIALGLNRFLLFRSICDLILMAVFNGIFIIWLGYNGAAVATVFTVYFMHLPINLFRLKRALDCSLSSLLPIKEFFLNFVRLSPLIACNMLVYFVFEEGQIVPLIINSILAFLFLAYWWNGRIYNLNDCLRKIGIES